MARFPSPNRRAGALLFVLGGLGLISAGTVAAMSIRGGGGSVESTSTKPIQIEPGEVATVLHLIGLTPEALAAAGATSTDCESMFSTGGAYCLQAERLDQLQLAHRALNQATNHAVHPEAAAPMDQANRPISVAQARIVLENLNEGAFSFVTTGLNGSTLAKLTRIRGNSSWKLPAPYLTVDRTDQEWLALRGALAARDYATRTSVPLDTRSSQVLAEVESNATIAQALQDFAGHLASMRQAWDAHQSSVP